MRQRQRILNPDVLTDVDLAQTLTPTERLFFIGLWTIADREGRLEDKPKEIKIFTMPHDRFNVERVLQKCHDANGILERYEVKGKRYIQINPNAWTKYQSVHPKEKASIIPRPVIPRNSPEFPEKDGLLTSSSTSTSTSTSTSILSAAQKRTPKKTNPDHKLVVKYFCEKYQDKVGAVYGFHGKEDGGKVTTLLSRWSRVQIEYLIDTMFNSADEFYRTGGGYSIGVLLANDNKLVQEAKRVHEGTDRLSAAGAKTADSMAKVLKKLEKEECPKLKLP